MGDSLPSPGTPWPSSAVERAPGAVILEGCSMGEDRKHMGGRERAGCGWSSQGIADGLFLPQITPLLVVSSSCSSPSQVSPTSSPSLPARWELFLGVSSLPFP